MAKRTFSDDDAEVAFESCWCTAETEKAILVYGATDDPLWVPKSQVLEESEVYKKGTDGELIISRWWAKQRGII